MNAKPVRSPTSAEIDSRLRIVAELRNLCLSLGRAHAAAAGGNPLQMHPELAATMLHDPTEPASEDEWPSEFR